MPRFGRIDWKRAASQLDERGYALLPELLSVRECVTLVKLWDRRELFRKHVDLARHRFGLGAYRYLAYPLPPPVRELRQRLYPPLARLANGWLEALGREERFPTSLRHFLAHCHTHGQTRPTPLLLRYEAEGYNCMHQDLYGAVAFPLQVTCLLSDPRREFTGGEFVLVEQRPRQQSRAEAVALRRGEAIVFPTRERPVRGQRGFYRTQMRHGVSRVRSGERLTLGLIFHDAR